MIPDHKARNQFSKRSRGCGIIFVVAATAFVAILFSTAGPFRSVSGKGVSAEEANQLLWVNKVPESASDVWFDSSYKATKIDCKLTRADFLAWCESRGWKPRPIIETKDVYLDRLQDAVLVEAGLIFDDVEGDVGSSGIYDDAAGRAYVSYGG